LSMSSNDNSCESAVAPLATADVILAKPKRLTRLYVWPARIALLRLV
jgi:hypothetical protein